MREKWSHWRHGATNREPIGRPEDCRSLTRRLPATSSFGSITSKRKPDEKEIRWIAYKHGVSMSQAKALIEKGLV